MKRDAILQEWRVAMLNDPSLPQTRTLSPSALDDEVPQLVDRLVVALDHPSLGDEAVEGRKLADCCLPVDHARARVSQGFTLSAAMRELAVP